MTATPPEHASPGEEPRCVQRMLAFSLVGGLGILLQLFTLAALTGAVGLHYLLATGLAVETTVLHNFFWHEHWTWSDRAGRNKQGRWMRLWRFQATNGALSVGGNLILMQLLAGTWKMNYTLANIASVGLCCALNFLASDRLVFRRPPRGGRPQPDSFCVTRKIRN